MFHVVLFEPEIPPNTGNIIRLCANTGCRLHLVEPLGFELDDKRLRRAGLDYHEWANVKRYECWEDCKLSLGQKRMFALSTKGLSCYTEVSFRSEDVFVFGPETRGLPDNILDDINLSQCLRIPMLKDSRSLNLSNSAAVVIYEAWRQLQFVNGVV